jgi:hypothetical protein
MQPNAKTPTSQISGIKTTDLNNGDTATLAYKDFIKSVRVFYNKTSETVEIQAKNIGTKAFTDSESSKVYVVDWGGVQYYPWYIENIVGVIVFPGETISTNLLLDDLIMNGLVDGVRPDVKAKHGQMTIYVTFGDKKASWIFTP